MLSSGASFRAELLPGTLDLIVLQASATMGPQHVYALAARLGQVSDHPLAIQRGTLYPALVRLDQEGPLRARSVPPKGSPAIRSCRA